MDLLGGYGSDSEDDKEQQQSLKPPGPVEVPHKPVTVTLPNPFAAEPASTASAASKRPFTAVVGHSLPATVSKNKVSKEHAAAGPAAGRKTAAVMLPPQLAGRANVSTEDTEKMFSKAPAAAKSTAAADVHPQV